MRLLDLSEYWLVTGGDGMDEDPTIPTVVVVGQAPPPTYNPPPYYPPPPPIYTPPPVPPPPPGYSSGGYTPPPPCIHYTPPPPYTPSNVNLNALRDTAASLRRTLMTMDKSVEHSAFIFADAAGHLRTSPIFTSTSADNTGKVAIAPNAGEHIVGWIHSHPSSWAVDQRLPSNPDNKVDPNLPSDTEMVNLMTYSSSVDTNMLYYISDVRTGDTYEYNPHMGLRPSLGNDISADTAGCTR